MASKLTFPDCLSIHQTKLFVCCIHLIFLSQYFLNYFLLPFDYRPKKQPKKRACLNEGNVKIEPDEIIYVIMTDKDMYKYQSKDVFDEALEKFKTNETLAFLQGSSFFVF